MKGLMRIVLIGLVCIVCFLTFSQFPESSSGQSPDEYYKLAEGFFNEHTYKRAYENYEKFLELAKEKDERIPVAMDNSLTCLYKLNQYSDAEEKAKTIIEKYKNTIWEAKTHYTLANVFTKWKQRNEFERTYNEFVTAREIFLKYAEQGLDEYVQASFDFAEFIKRYYYEKRSELAGIYDDIYNRAKNKEDRANALLQKGYSYELYIDDYNKINDYMLEVFNKILFEFPSSQSAPFATFRIANIYENQQKYIKALKYYEQLIIKFPNHKDVDNAMKRIEDIKAERLNLTVERIFRSGEPVKVSINVRNLKEIKFALYKIDFFDFFEKVKNPHEILRYPIDKTQLVKNWSFNTGDTGEHQWINTQVEIPTKESGAYILQGIGKKNENKTLLIITKLSIVAKWSSNKTILFVTDAITGKPKADIQVKIGCNRKTDDVNKPYNQQYYYFSKILNEKTNSDGICEVDNIIPEINDYSVFVAAREGEDYAVTNGWLQNWYGAETREMCYFYTDRPVYRPDQTVHFKGIYRVNKEGEYINNPNTTLKVEIRDAKNNVIYGKQHSTNEFGTFSGELTLSKEPPLGMYYVSIRSAQDRNIGWYNFRVEEYKKPEFEVKITTDKKQFRIGDKITAIINAKYYFGEPVVEGKINYTITRSAFVPYWVPFRDYGWYFAESEYFRPPIYGFRQQTVLTGEGFTNEEGNFEMTFDTAVSQKEIEEIFKSQPPSFSYKIEANVVDKSRRNIQGSSEIKVTKKAFSLFLSSELYMYSPGDRIKITIRSENANNEPVACAGEITAYKANYNEEKKDYVYDEVSRDKVNISEKGDGKYEFTCDEEGYFKIEMVTKDEYGEIIVGECWVWVTSESFRGTFYKYSNIQIITDKDSYKEGETIHLLLNSQFPDAYVLLSIETNVVHKYIVVPIEGKSKRVDIPVEKGFVPNIFINAILINDFKLFQDTKEIIVPPINKFIKLVIKAPKESFLPREEADFEIIAQDDKGNPVSAEFSLGIVDASIYYIQPELAQDIQQFFYGQKRYHYVNTTSVFDYNYYGESGVRRGAAKEGIYLGTAVMEMPAKPASAKMVGDMAEMKDKKELKVPEIREYFPDTTFWGAHIVTDNNGEAKVHIKFPDSLTTWRSTVRAVSRDLAVGNITQDVVTKKNVIVRLETPRFFTERDEVTISAIVHNYLLTNKEAKVILETKGINLIGDAELKKFSTSIEKNIIVKSNSEVRVDFHAKIEKSGEAVLIAKALTDEESDAMKLTIPILPHGVEKFIAKIGDTGEKSTIELDIPEERIIDSSELIIDVSPSIASVMFDALDYLADYPYGCVEQTMSRFMPSAIVAKTLKDFGLKNEKLDARLSDIMKAGLERLYDFQLSNGGWGWWKYGGANNYMTAYVIYGLTIASQSGYEINQDVISRGITCLKENLKEEDENLNTLAFMLYSLSYSKNTDEKYLNHIWEKRDELNDYSRALFAIALSNMGDKQRAEIMLRNLEDYATIDKENDTASFMSGKSDYWWYWYNDRVEATAMALKAFMTIDPDNPITHKIMRWLVYNRRGNRWKSTKDTAIAIFALNDYLRHNKELDSNYDVEVYLNQRLLKKLSVRPENIINFDGRIIVEGDGVPSGKAQIEIVKKGTGKLYYSTYLKYFTLEEDIKGAGNEIFVNRKYYKLIPRITAEKKTEYDKVVINQGDVLKSNDLVEVELNIEAKNNYEYLVFEDMKPAGFEPVELRSGRQYAEGLCSNMELRDEKVVFFITNLMQGKHTITYKMRAEIPGSFHTMPTNGYAMYVPEIRGISNELRVGIED